MNFAGSAKLLRSFAKVFRPSSSLRPQCRNPAWPAIKYCMLSITGRNDRAQVALITKCHVEQGGITKGDALHGVRFGRAKLLHVGCKWKAAPKPNTSYFTPKFTP